MLAIALTALSLEELVIIKADPDEDSSDERIIKAIYLRN
jgi:hypothetical protein